MKIIGSNPIGTTKIHGRGRVVKGNGLQNRERKFIVGSNPTVRANIKVMNKEERKKQKIRDRILELESNLKESLTKKTSSMAEVNIGAIQSEIARLKKLLT